MQNKLWNYCLKGCPELLETKKKIHPSDPGLGEMGEVLIRGNNQKQGIGKLPWDPIHKARGQSFGAEIGQGAILSYRLVIMKPA